MVFVYISCGAAAFLLITFIAVSVAVFIKAYYSGRRKDVTYKVLSGKDYDPYHDKMLDVIKTAVKIPYEEIGIRSYDGKKLYGRLYLKDPSAPFHIQFNGYRGNGLRDFSGGLQLALESGGNVILTDQRSHGKSEGSVITFGVKERKDVQSWVNYVCETYGDVPVFLEGISMGAATVLMSADLPMKNVRGIVADCPYSSPFGIVSLVARRIFNSGKILDPCIVFSAFVFGHFNILSSSALESVKATKIPILIIHGNKDNFVPLSMSRDIRDANPDMVTLVEIEGAPHGLSYLTDTEKYKKVLFDFIADKL
ncbi:MAG: alpha/beta fold hydrolase [Clostridia bacterium]|nr:alpha/beta fold hydrolase [Clostridia bacterium]